MGQKRHPRPTVITEQPAYEWVEYRLIYQDKDGNEKHTRGTVRAADVLRSINALPDDCAIVRIETRRTIRGESQWFKL